MNTLVKTLSYVLLLLLVFFGVRYMTSQSKDRELNQLRTTVQQLELELSQRKMAAHEWETTNLRLSDELKSCQSAWEAATATQKEQAAKQAKMEADHAAELEQWKQKASARTLACSDVLRQLDSVCPELEGY